MESQLPSLPDFIENSPASSLAAQNIAWTLSSGGFTRLDEADSWHLEPGGAYLVSRGGGLAAFRMGQQGALGMNIALAHTDSPGLKVKLRNQEFKGNLIRAGVEVYGSPLFSTWFDRELSIAGQVVTLEGGRVRVQTIDFKDPMGIIPSLAIHYNREANRSPSAVDPQNHLSVLISPEVPQDRCLEDLICRRFSLEREKIVDHDLFLYPVQPPLVIGRRLLSAGRIDNLAGCHSVLQGIWAPGKREKTSLGFFFEAEEVGSLTRGGADSGFMNDLMTRITLAGGGSEEDVFRARAQSFCISVDAAHGVHPNYPDRHDPSYAPVLGGGPVVKAAAGARYATTAGSAARFESLCRTLDIPVQRYIMRSDLTPGSTVGPVTSALGGIETVDVGIPIWAMHSARETCDLEDHTALARVLEEFYRS